MEAAAAPGSAPISFYASSGVQKAVLFARYTDLLQTWWGCELGRALVAGRGPARSKRLPAVVYLVPATS